MMKWLRKRLGPPGWRAGIRCAILVLAALLASPLFARGWGSLILPILSPFTMPASALAARAVSLTILPALVLGLIVARRRRWFCRWVCPTGCCQELLGRRGAARAQWKRWPVLSYWIAGLALGGAALGHPPLLWLDPLAIFNGFWNILRQDLGVARWADAIGLPLLLAFNVWAPKTWCLRLCPLGAMQDLLWMRARILRRARGIPGKMQPEEGGNAGVGIMRRRTLLGAGLGAGWSLTTRKTHGGTTQPIRPPGAVDEAQFTSLCLRCGNCLRACPRGILKAAGPADGWAGLLTPKVQFDPDYCEPECVACGTNCPSGAIRRLRLRDKFRRPMGLAKVENTLCLMAQGKECTQCQNCCSFEAIDVGWDAENMVSQPAIDAKRCTGCGICQVACVTSPVKALRVFSL